jgi:hypothetical protein
MNRRRHCRRRAAGLLVALAGSFVLAVSGAEGSTSGLLPARLLASAKDCAPLPPPEGQVVRVSTEPELQAAVRSLVSDTTILIAPGEYILSNSLHLQGGLERVSIRGEGGDRDAVILTGRGMENDNFGNVPHGILVSDAAAVTIADLTIREVYYHAVQVQGEAGAVDATLYNLRLVDAGEQLVKGSSAGPPGPYADRGLVACSWLGYTDRARSDYTNGVDVLAGADWVVRDNDFVRIRAPIGQLAGPAVLFWRNSLRTIVERNRFLECDRAIALGLSAPDLGRARDGEPVFDHQDGIVRNNFIYRSAFAPTADVGITVNHHRDFKILHNTVIQNGSFPQATIEYRFASSKGFIIGNLTDGPIWRRDNGLAALDHNLLEADAGWFIAASVGDLHLRAGSPAIDAMLAVDDALDDFDGDPRPLGARADIGADEWVRGPEPSPTAEPSEEPTAEPSTEPTAEPTAEPSATAATPALSPTPDRGLTATPVPSATAGSGHRLYLPLLER